MPGIDRLLPELEHDTPGPTEVHPERIQAREAELRAIWAGVEPRSERVRAVTGVGFRPFGESLRDDAESLPSVGGVTPKLRPRSRCVGRSRILSGASPHQRHEGMADTRQPHSIALSSNRLKQSVSHEPVNVGITNLVQTRVMNSGDPKLGERVVNQRGTVEWPDGSCPLGPFAWRSGRFGLAGGSIVRWAWSPTVSTARERSGCCS